MKKILLSSFIGIIVFIGCAGVSDIYEDLPNGYIYICESKNQKLIMKNPLSIDSNLYIPCKIVKYTFNKNYIIAKIKFHYDINYGTVGFQESKQLKEGKNYYYIIDTIKNIRYGAFENYEDFNKKLKILNIELNMND